MTPDDIDNQRAVQLAKQVDPAGIRTIGTLYPHSLRDISQTGVWLPRRPHKTRYTSVWGYSSKGPVAGRHRRTQTYYKARIFLYTTARRG